MQILGINAYHGDAAAAIIRDGALITAGKAGQEAFMNWETVKTQLSRWKISNITVTSMIRPMKLADFPDVQDLTREKLQLVEEL